MADAMTIGRLAKAAGVNVETIRYYQRRGLIEAPQKPLGGQRRYPGATLVALGFIRRAQQLGFSLEEVRALMSLGEKADCGEARLIAERKHAVLQTRVTQLVTQLGQLEAFIEACKRAKGRGPCPFVGALWRPEEPV
jgi:MerR family mercuric resistance operon transcriptional regulator